MLRLMYHAGCRLFIVSNKPRHICLRILETEGVLHCFETIVTRDSRSPYYCGKEEMIEGLLVKSAIGREHSVMVGDTTDDAQAAAAVGIEFVWMTHGYGSAIEMSSFPTAHSFDNFSQFSRLLAKEPVCD